MKIILLSITLCTLINSANGQTAFKQGDLMKPENDIVSNISAFEHSSIFLESLKSCDLVDTFNNPGPLTVFLPQDSAFNKLPSGKMDTLLQPPNKYDLIALMTYHALPGKISVKDIEKEIKREDGLAKFRTISGSWLRAQFDKEKNIILVDGKGRKSILRKGNLKQSNGLIHLVSGVLLPKFKSI